MHACNVDLHIGLHPAAMITARAAPHLMISDWMSLRDMLVQPALLNKSPIASGYRADILHISCVLLHMVEHRVLSLLGYRAERALECAIGRANVGCLDCYCSSSSSSMGGNVSHLRW